MPCSIRINLGRGQAGTEFMVLLGMMLVFLTLMIVLYNLQLTEASAVRDKLEAEAICSKISAAVNGMAATGANFAFPLSLPPNVNGKDYVVYINASAALVKVDYASAGVGCGIRTTAVSNSTGSGFFSINKSTVLGSTNGAVVFVP